MLRKLGLGSKRNKTKKGSAAAPPQEVMYSSTMYTMPSSLSTSMPYTSQPYSLSQNWQPSQNISPIQNWPLTNPQSPTPLPGQQQAQFSPFSSQTRFYPSPSNYMPNQGGQNMPSQPSQDQCLPGQGQYYPGGQGQYIPGGQGQYYPGGQGQGQYFPDQGQYTPGGPGQYVPGQGGQYPSPYVPQNGSGSGSGSVQCPPPEDYQREVENDPNINQLIDQVIASIPPYACGVRPPQHRREERRISSQCPPRVANIRRRLPSPEGDVIERTTIIQNPQDVINLIVEKPGMPPPCVLEKTSFMSGQPPRIQQSVVCVQPTPKPCPIADDSQIGPQPQPQPAPQPAPQPGPQAIPPLSQAIPNWLSSAKYFTQPVQSSYYWPSTSFLSSPTSYQNVQPQLPQQTFVPSSQYIRYQPQVTPMYSSTYMRQPQFPAPVSQLSGQQLQFPSPMFQFGQLGGTPTSWRVQPLSNIPVTSSYIPVQTSVIQGPVQPNIQQQPQLQQQPMYQQQPQFQQWSSSIQGPVQPNIQQQPQYQQQPQFQQQPQLQQQPQFQQQPLQSPVSPGTRSYYWPQTQNISRNIPTQVTNV